MLGDISGVENIYIVCGYTDMRKAIDPHPLLPDPGGTPERAPTQGGRDQRGQYLVPDRHLIQPVSQSATALFFSFAAYAIFKNQY